MISCLVSVTGKVYAADGIHSHSKIAAHFKINEDKHLKYEFDLTTRTLKQDFQMDAAPFAAKASHDAAAQRFFDTSAGNAKQLIAFVKRGNRSEEYLRSLLSAPAQKAYDEAVAQAWKAYYAAVAQAQKAYYAAVAQAGKAYYAAVAPAQKAYDEVVAQAGKAYDEAVAQAWCRLFAKRENRIEVWAN
jgi:hypothetical protein